MLNYFPNHYVEDVYAIDYEALLARGYHALIFDIDNTLVPHGQDATPQVEQFFARLHAMGFKTLLLSNNSEERIGRFNRNIDTLYIADAGKPSKQCFEQAMHMLDSDRRHTLVIGDTTHTDIAGANRAGLPSILVKYIGYYDNDKKGIRRTLEKFILFFYPLAFWKRRIY